MKSGKQIYDEYVEAQFVEPSPTADRIADRRPPNCRFRLRDEGKPYPRSACMGCGATITTGLGTYCTRLRNEQPKGVEPWCEHSNCPPHECDVCSSSAPSPGSQDVRFKLRDLLWHLIDDARYMRNVAEYEYMSGELAEKYAEKIAALAQSDALPSIDEDAADEAYRKWFAAIAQSQFSGLNAFKAGCSFALRARTREMTRTRKDNEAR